MSLNIEQPRCPRDQLRNRHPDWTDAQILGAVSAYNWDQAASGRRPHGLEPPAKTTAATPGCGPSTLFPWRHPDQLTSARAAATHLPANQPGQCVHRRRCDGTCISTCVPSANRPSPSRPPQPTRREPPLRRSETPTTTASIEDVQPGLAPPPPEIRVPATFIRDERRPRKCTQ